MMPHAYGEPSLLLCILFFYSSLLTFRSLPPDLSITLGMPSYKWGI